MQLLVAHLILVASTIALAALFGIRSLVLFSKGGASVDLAMAVVSLALVGALGLYFRSVRGKWLALKGAQGQPKK
jgi:hypothetical protein